MTDSPTDPKSALTEAAARLFAEHGYGAVSIDRITAEVGATKGLFYHHFSAKGDILADIVVGLRTRTLAAAATALDRLAPDARPEARLEALALAELNCAAAEPAAARVAAWADPILATARMADERRIARDLAVEARQSLERLYQNVYRDGVRAGRLEPLPPRFAVWLIRLPIVAATDWAAGPDGARTPADRVAEAVARFASRGLLES